ncbi:unnamed protein product [Amoebophrya sp. A25]|nr:unnamed protein product [Amoebophrya sp. A25]|eukprot:GSA25T00002755001.1
MRVCRSEDLGLINASSTSMHSISAYLDETCDVSSTSFAEWDRLQKQMLEQTLPRRSVAAWGSYFIWETRKSCNYKSYNLHQSLTAAALHKLYRPTGLEHSTAGTWGCAHNFRLGDAQCHF